MAGERQVSTCGEVDTKEAGGKRRRWPEALKRQLVAETFEPGASVSIVARRHDVNANQLFSWRRRFAGSARVPGVELLPIEIGPEPVAPVAAAVGGLDRDRLVRRGAGQDQGCRRSGGGHRGRGGRDEGTSTSVIPFPSGTRVWLATGHTDMRRGMNGLALQVQEVLQRDPYGGHVFVFRGRRGDCAT